MYSALGKRCDLVCMASSRLKEMTADRSYSAEVDDTTDEMIARRCSVVGLGTGELPQQHATAGATMVGDAGSRIRNMASEAQVDETVAQKDVGWWG